MTQLTDQQREIANRLFPALDIFAEYFDGLVFDLIKDINDSGLFLSIVIANDILGNANDELIEVLPGFLMVTTNALMAIVSSAVGVALKSVEYLDEFSKWDELNEHMLKTGLTGKELAEAVVEAMLNDDINRYLNDMLNQARDARLDSD